MHMTSFFLKITFTLFFKDISTLIIIFKMVFLFHVIVPFVFDVCYRLIVPGIQINDFLISMLTGIIRDHRQNKVLL